MKQLNLILQSRKIYFIIIIFTCFYVFLNVKVIHYKSVYNLNTKEFIGTVTKIKKTDYGYSINLKAKENLIVYINDFNCHLGDLIYIKGDLNIPKNNTVLNNFNYKKYLHYNKIYYTLNAKEIKLLKENENIIYQLKTKLINYLDAFKSSIFLKSFILGDTSYLGNDLYKSYQINGICHLLSIGSSHITLLSISLLWLFRKLKVKELISYLILFIIIFFYLLLTDCQIAIMRVYLYLIISYLNKKLKFNLKPINLFIIVIFITLLLNPFYIYHRGFLYSYSMSFILILIKDKIKGNYFTKILKISLICFLYSIPFNIYFNYSINLLSVFYNLIYVPAFNIIIFPLSLLTIIFPIFDKLFYEIMNILNNLSYFFNNFLFGTIILKKMSIIILIIYLIIFTYLIKNLFERKFMSLIILFVILILHVHINDFIKKDFFMVIDVGQGDSILFYSNNKTVLVDTGGLYKRNNIVKTITMLHSLGISKIDYLFLTHGDYDHMGDSLYLVSHFKVLNVIFNTNDFNELEQNLVNYLEKKKINYCIGYKNSTYTINNVKIMELNSRHDNENDSSLVMYILFKNKKILLMGDAGIMVENEILNNYKIGSIDYLKVGHHGSKTSTSEELLKTLKPKYAFISVGLNNLYHHPSLDILNRLKEYNVKTYQTKDVGSIIINLDGTIKCLVP